MNRARKIAPQMYEIAPGVIVQPIWSERKGREVQDGWQVVRNGEYEQDFRLKSQAVEFASSLS